MNNKLQKVNEILKKYNQEHLVYFYNELSTEQQALLLNQILSIDFNKIFTLYHNSMKDSVIERDCISPLKHYEKNTFSNYDIHFYSNIGIDFIKSNSVAVVTMAGGQGSRLGYSGPKGTYELEFETEKKSLFQIMCEDIQKINSEYDVTIPWYIMTSNENDLQTKKYFEEKNYFGYPKNKVTFFTQDKLPIISVDGNLILKETYMIKEASNGNGNVFKAMKKHGIIDELEKNHIKWLFFGGIDNILLKNIDPFFLGLTSYNNYSIATKSIFKQEPLEKTAVFCKNNNKPSILNYNDIDLELSQSKDSNGLYLYREANMLSHIMNIDAIKKIAEINLPYHRAYKKNAFVNTEGMKQVPDKPNSFKFENFIFDAFMFFDDLLVLRANPDEEFAPIKDFTGIYNPDTAKEKYEKYHQK